MADGAACAVCPLCRRTLVFDNATTLEVSRAVPAAVRQSGCPRDKTRIARCEKQSDLGDLVLKSKAGRRRFPDPCRTARDVRSRMRGAPHRGDTARSNRIYDDPGSERHQTPAVAITTGPVTIKSRIAAFRNHSASIRAIPPHHDVPAATTAADAPRTRRALASPACGERF